MNHSSHELSSPTKERLMSLDVFRGATMASMLLVNNPGDWGHLYSQLDHAEWNGWTFTDLIFPFFLWIVGVAMPLSMGRRMENGEPRVKAFGRIVRRSLIIVGLGLLLNGFPFYHVSTMRFPGVLQRIGICYCCAGIIYLGTKIRGQATAIIVLLTMYWLLMALAPVPGGQAGVLTAHGSFAEYVDSIVLGKHVWKETAPMDPEGIISTLPAIATVLFGILTGQLLRTKLDGAEKTAWMFVAGLLLLWAGLILNHWLPINKKLWTSTYSIFMAGMASVVFATCYWLVDLKRHQKWARPFSIYGMNAITVFVLTGLLGRLSTMIPVAHDGDKAVMLKAWLFQHLRGGFEAVGGPLATPNNSSLLYALGYVALMYLVAWFMYRRKWFVRF